MQGSLVAVDGHIVVVQHDEKIRVFPSGVVESLKRQPSGHRTVPDHRHDLLARARQLGGFGHSKRRGD